ncbi:putative spermidine/putrescine transport system ATP-binding protein [Mycetocola sp. CAN_C7]|uniref:ABC transporter ATP-binding protein n=1 Tax=Mycetocola sp. CAN_C7 TaxID=2787724 RepID=UPI0018C9A8DE
MTSAIALSSISKTFAADAVPALNGVNLDVLPGTCTAILGPSGSGKSTILRIIAGLEDPSGGGVFVNGVDMTSVLPENRRIGMVFQRPLLFPHLSVIDNVAFADRAAGLSKAEARRNALRFLDMVQLEEFASRPIRSLSGGQEQRVAVARVLAARPAILLLDEPFSALDAALRDDMHQLLADIRASLSPTVLLVTHDRDEAAAVADRIAVVEGGQLLQHDTVDRIYHRPSCRAVARLMGGRNFVDGVAHDGAHHSAVGRVTVDENIPEGPGALVVRQEAIAVATASPSRSLAADEFAGVVSAVQRNGARRSIVIGVDEIDIHAELPPGVNLPVGAPVVFTLPRESVSVVAR